MQIRGGQAPHDQGGHPVLRGSAGPGWKVRPIQRHVELWRHHVRPALWLSTFLWRFGRAGVGQSAQGRVHLRQGRLEIGLGRREESHHRFVEDECVRANDGCASLDPSLDKGPRTSGACRESPVHLRHEAAPLQVSSQAQESCSADHRGTVERRGVEAPSRGFHGPRQGPERLPHHPRNAGGHGEVGHQRHPRRSGTNHGGHRLGR
mmetsp:Transcript_52574/g.140075  ORF Transcript_52574/g.140075 Transcript_52574/m.140075 type:complete len:206 (-) Transcript_52574:457-1074(-)